MLQDLNTASAGLVHNVRITSEVRALIKSIKNHQNCCCPARWMLEQMAPHTRGNISTVAAHLQLLCASTVPSPCAPDTTKHAPSQTGSPTAPETNRILPPVGPAATTKWRQSPQLSVCRWISSDGSSRTQHGRHREIMQTPCFRLIPIFQSPVKSKPCRGGCHR